MDADHPLKRVVAAADAAETAATKLQIKTEDASLDAQAESAKDLVHDVRGALDEIKAEEPVDATAAYNAKMAAAALAVEEELKLVSQELDGASVHATGAAGEGVAPPKTGHRKSTKQAMKELALLAQVSHPMNESPAAGGFVSQNTLPLLVFSTRS